MVEEKSNAIKDKEQDHWARNKIESEEYKDIRIYNSIKSTGILVVKFLGAMNVFTMICGFFGY